MSSVNIGTMSAELGLDFTAYENGMRRAEALTREGGERMSAEMKRTSREGAESLRLIDESLGIHLSRPLTRILTQEFPALASALQSVLGGAVFGAVATAAFEFGEHIARAMEKARKAQDEFQNALEKTRSTYEESMAVVERDIRVGSLTGLDRKLAEIDVSSIERARKEIDALADAFTNAAKKAEEASSIWTKALGALGEFAHITFTSTARLNVEQTDKQFEEIKKHFDELSSQDLARGTNEAMKYLNEQLEAAQAKLAEMQKAGPPTFRTITVAPGATAQVRTGGFTQLELDAEKRLLDSLQDEVKLRDAIASKAGQDKGQTIAIAQAETLSALYRDIEAGLSKLAPADPFAKLQTEVAALKIRAEDDFRALGESAATALELRSARQQLEEYERKLDAIVAKAKLDADIAKAQAQLPKPTPAGELPNLSALPLPTPVLQLAPERPDLSELRKVQTDVNEAYAEAGRVLAQLETPEEKHAVMLQILKELEDQGRISQQQYAAAVAQAGTAMAVAEEHLRKLQDEMQRLLEHSTSATAGMQAFWKQLQISAAENGLFAFDLLNQASKGVADNLANAVTDGTRNWKREWQSLARDLERTTFKFTFDKAIAGIGGELGKSGLGKTIGEMVKIKPAAPAGAPAVEAGGKDLTALLEAPKTLLPLFGARPAIATVAGAARDTGLSANTAALGLNSTALSTLNSTILTQGAQRFAPTNLTGKVPLFGESETPATEAGAPAIAATIKAPLAEAAKGAIDTTAVTANTTALGVNTSALTALSSAVLAQAATKYAPTNLAGPIPLFGGGRAVGGDVTPGFDYLVGEQGPEILRMGASSAPGTIIPNSQLGRGGDTHISIDNRGADPAAIARLERMLPLVQDRAVALAASMNRENSLRKRPG